MIKTSLPTLNTVVSTIGLDIILKLLISYEVAISDKRELIEYLIAVKHSELLECFSMVAEPPSKVTSSIRLFQDGSKAENL